MKYTHALLGGSGHIGRHLADALLKKQDKVLIIGHDKTKADEWSAKGASYEVADVKNSRQLNKLFSQTERLFILNPPATPDSNTDAVEQEQIAAILQALAGLKFDKIVAVSTYGAQKGDDIFDLGTLYEL